jgi:hypothetical protein
MKTSLALLPLALVIATYSSFSVADDDWGRHGHGHHGHHRHHREYDYDGGYQNDRGYYPQPQQNYYQQPQPVYQQQQPYYQPRQSYQDPRSHQGLAGGVVGSVLGYEIGNGDPIAAGLGAAAGSFLGNGLRR